MFGDLQLRDEPQRDIQIVQQLHPFRGAVRAAVDLNFTFSTLLIGWMPGATGLSPYVVKFIAMACQFGWGYPLCKYVIFR